jgi:hypothetical protein
MCSKLLEEVQNRLKTLKAKAFEYPDLIEWRELDQRVKEPSSFVNTLIENHKKDPYELRKVYQQVIAPL